MTSERSGADDHTYTGATEPPEATKELRSNPAKFRKSFPNFVEATLLLFVSKLLMLQWYATMEVVRRKLLVMVMGVRWVQVRDGGVL